MSAPLAAAVQPHRRPEAILLSEDMTRQRSVDVGRLSSLISIVSQNGWELFPDEAGN